MSAAHTIPFDSHPYLAPSCATMNIAVYHNLGSGGAKRSLYERVRRLASRHSVDVFTTTTSDPSFCDLRPFARSHCSYAFTPRRLFRSPIGRLNQLQRWRDLRRLDRLGRRVAADIDRQGYDVVVVEPCRWSQAPALLQYLRTPSVYYCHEVFRAMYETSSEPAAERRGLRRLIDRTDPLIRLYRSAARRADQASCQAASTVLTNSRYTRDVVARTYGLAAQVCYLGVDTEVFRPAMGGQRGDFVLSVGALYPTKGFELLIESLAMLPGDERPPLLLVGNAEIPAYRRQLQELAERLGVELRIELSVSQDQLIGRLQDARLFAYAPRKEPFGLAALEAMACGTPVVAVAEGGVRETVIPGTSGILVERDPTLFAEAIGDLLTNPARLAEVGERGRAYVLSNWSWDSAVDRFESHLIAAATSRRGAPARRQ